LPTSLKAILFDADGVIQRPAIDYASAFAELFTLQRDDAHSLIDEIFAAERPTLTGGSEFAVALEKVLSHRGIAHCLQDVLRIWTSIEPDPAILASIASLRALGILCCLATNQQAHRARHMSEALRYGDVFDFQFYSHSLGVAKPDTHYFRRIIEQLNLDPSDVLFIDDHEPNVTAARKVGLHAALFAAPPPNSSAALRMILLRHGVQYP
jgi:putative hydrolase of the HAD superfamily